MKIYLLRFVFIVALLAAWQILSPWFGVTFYISTPHDVAQALWRITSDGTLAHHASITGFEAVLGFLLGGTLGMVIGLLFGRFNLLADVAEPFLMAFYSLPKAALAPLFILWFGIGIDMKVIMAASIVFFLVFLNTYTGVRQVSREQVAILRLMGAKEHHIITKVVIPSAITWVFAGLRLSVPYALIGAIVGEIIAANQGMGYLLAHAAGNFNTAGTFAAIIAIMILALLLNAAVRILEVRLLPWREAESRREVSV